MTYDVPLKAYFKYGGPNANRHIYRVETVQVHYGGGFYRVGGEGSLCVIDKPSLQQEREIYDRERRLLQQKAWGYKPT